MVCSKCGRSLEYEFMGCEVALRMRSAMFGVATLHLLCKEFDGVVEGIVDITSARMARISDISVVSSSAVGSSPPEAS